MRPLSPIKKDQKRKTFAVVDSETWGLGGKLAFGCIYKSPTEKFVFYSKSGFYDIIKEQKIKLIYAHNLDFDMTKIRECAAFENVKEQPIYAGGLLLTVTDDTGLIWRDSFAILRSSVSNLGASLGLKKLETPKKFIKPGKNEIITQTDIKYCFRDCRIVFDFLNKIFDLTGCQRLTIASTAMFYFQRNYLRKNYFKHSLHERFGESYYGGRVEAFKFGKVNAKVFDVNSLYPYAMKNIVLPDFQNLTARYNPDLQTFKEFLFKFEGMAKVKIEIPRGRVGLLPYKYDQKLTFPTGTITGQWNFNEIRFAIKHGAKILKCNFFIFSYRKMKNFFSEYVDDLYKLKKNSEGAEKLIYKFLLNSLYGKFGQRKFEAVEYLDDEKFIQKVKELIKEKTPYRATSLKSNLNYICYENNTIENTPHSILTVASYITSAARVVLGEKLIEYAQDVVYCDTDSIALENTEIKTGKKLGEWDLEPYRITKIFGNKFYKTDKSLKLKGVPKRAKIYGKKFEYEKLIKSREAMRTGKTAGTTENFKKAVNFDYTKRLRVGNDSTPLHF